MVNRFMYSSTIILVMLTFSNCTAQKKDNSEKVIYKNDLKIDTLSNHLKRNYGEVEGVSLTLSKFDSSDYNILVTAPLEDSADCYCPAWYSTPVAGMRFFGRVLDEAGQCDENVTLNGQACGFYIVPGDTMEKNDKLFGYQGYSNLVGKFDITKYYLQCTHLSIPDSNGNVPSHTGEFPIYEIDSSYSVLDITLSLDKKCVLGELKNKNELFKKNGLSISVAIDATKSFPVAKQVK